MLQQKLCMQVKFSPVQYFSIDISWYSYRHCLGSFILVHPVHGGMLHSFVEIVYTYKKIESLEVVRPHLQKYAGGDILQTTTSVHGYKIHLGRP